MNLLEQLNETCKTPALVRTFGYGYLDALVQDYADGKVDNQHLRKCHYMLRVAVETRLLQLEKIERAEAVRNLLISRKESDQDFRTRITGR